MSLYDHCMIIRIINVVIEEWVVKSVFVNGSTACFWDGFMYSRCVANYALKL